MAIKAVETDRQKRKENKTDGRRVPQSQSTDTSTDPRTPGAPTHSLLTPALTLEHQAHPPTVYRHQH